MQKKSEKIITNFNCCILKWELNTINFFPSEINQMNGNEQDFVQIWLHLHLWKREMKTFSMAKAQNILGQSVPNYRGKNYWIKSKITQNRDSSVLSFESDLTLFFQYSDYLQVLRTKDEKSRYAINAQRSIEIRKQMLAKKYNFLWIDWEFELISLQTRTTLKFQFIWRPNTVIQL
jgi:hypothetical protein